MTANPIDLIGGLATTGNVVKADISSWAKARVAQVLADATEVRNTVLALQLVIFVKALSATYRLDTTDTTTADDGVSCIISLDGFRFKPISSVPAPTLVSLGGVFASVSVAHQFLTGLDTSGNLLRAQPSASDLSDGLTGTGAVVRATSPALVTPALGAATATTLAVNGASIPGGAVVSAAGNITSTTGFVGPVLFGGVNTNSSLTVQTTPSASNSGDTLGLYGSTVTIGNQSSAASIINLNGASGGGVTVNIAASGNGLNALNVYNGAGSKQTWVPGGGATTITFPAATDTLMGRATADTVTNKGINASNNTITNLTTSMFATSVVDTDVTLAANSDTRIASQKATKAYVDATAQGLSPKQSVLCATTANVTLSGEQTIDGVLTSASRVLVKNQTTTANNGIYVSAAGAWTRSLDANAWSELTGAFVFVDAGGTVNGATGWVCIAAQGGTIGTTTVPFTQFSGAGTYTAGTGLTLTGTSFAIDGTVAILAGAQALTNKTYNGNTWTAGTGILTIAAAKTLTVSNSLTLAGTDGTVMTFPSTSGAVITSVSVNAVTNAIAAQAGAATFKGNPTNATANVTDFTIQGLTARGAPDAANDKIPIYDNAAGTIKYVTPSQVAGASSGTVTSIVGGIGLDGGTITTSGTLSLSAARRTLPTTQTLTSGSGATYTTPANALWLEVYIVGGGGGGAGSSNSGTTMVAGSDGAASTFNSVNANPGKGAGTFATAAALGGTGGTGTATRRVAGESGGVSNSNTVVALSMGRGGNSWFSNGAGAAAMPGTGAGIVGAANTGGGGSGGNNGAGSNDNSAGGGSGGETAYLIINSPAGTYTYTIGGGGSGGVSTTNGGSGGSGVIFVVEHYGS